ncbi:MAG TPA: AEC family transporter [Xanthobacteraceae bacterium]|nr:AEC family transporter [Xanthobacteraceae bacterium]
MAVISALLPVFLVIALGVLLKQTLLPERAAWDSLERLTFYVLFPALLTVTTATADLSEVPVGGVGGALALAILILATLLLIVRVPLSRALTVNGAAFTSVFQGAIRWNTYVALGIAGSLYGTPGLALASVAIVAMVPLLNLICVLVLARYAADESPDARTTAGMVLRNPLIWSVLAGIALNVSGVPLPPIAVSFAEILGQGALALGLLAVGAGLELGKVLRPSAAVIVTIVLKLAAMPAVAISLALGFGLDGAALTIVAVASSVPSAPGSYILARQMGGDAPLLANILSMQILVALVTIPAVLALVALLAK